MIKQLKLYKLCYGKRKKLKGKVCIKVRKQGQNGQEKEFEGKGKGKKERKYGKKKIREEKKGENEPR